MANEQYSKTGIVTMDDGAQISDPIIDWNGTQHFPKQKTVTLQVDYFGDVAQTAPTLSRHYDYVYTGDLDSFSTADGWAYLLTLPQHSGATLI